MGKITDLLKKIQAEREAQKQKTHNPLDEVVQNQLQTSEAMRSLSEKKTVIGQTMHAGVGATRDVFSVTSSTDTTEKSGIHEKVVTYYDYSSPVSEQYRILRTHVKSMMAHKANGSRKMYDKRVLTGSPSLITLTSSLVGEGKTLTCCNLAVALSHDLESKVLLIDCDLRKGSVSDIFGITSSPGLTDILLGNCHYSQAVHKTKIGNLFIIPHGKEPKHPSELLGSKNMQRLLEELRGENLNYVLLDTPPLMPFTDATLLGSMTDAIFLVVQAHRTRMPILKKAQDLLKQANASLTGCILNQTDYYIPDVYGSYYYYLHNRYYGKGNGNGNGNGTHATTSTLIENNEKTKDHNDVP